jgi:xylose isomerase
MRSRAGVSSDRVVDAALKTSLGIWALGPMVTRFVPGGYQPAHADESTAEKVARAVAGLGDLMDDYEFHYPQELSEDNLDDVRGALDGHGIYALATGTHLNPRFGKGGLSSPDDEVRADALAEALRAADFAGSVGAQMILWPGVEGYNYPFQTPYADAWARFVDGVGEVAARCHERGIKLFLEHKNSEPAMKILMRNIGMTLHVIHKLRERGLRNVQVNMDWQHLIMNGESLGEYAAMLAAEGLLGHQHANSGWGTFDDDNMVGATAFMETLELALELRRAGYGEHGERLGFDLYPYTEDAVAAVGRSVKQWNFIWDVSGRIDDAALHEAQSRKDAVRAYELVYAALGA